MEGHNKVIVIEIIVSMKPCSDVFIVNVIIITIMSISHSKAINP